MWSLAYREKRGKLLLPRFFLGFFRIWDERREREGRKAGGGIGEKTG
jgi:hypothetical protein